MNHIGKIDRCGAPRQRLHLASGGKNVNFIGKEIDAHILHEFAGIYEIFLVFHKVLYPGKFAANIFIEVLAFFIPPVGGNTGCGNFIHLPCSNLNLNALPNRSNHRGMQGLVHIRFGAPDVVFELMIDGLPQRMDVAQRLVTLWHRIKDDPEGITQIFYPPELDQLYDEEHPFYDSDKTYDLKKWKRVDQLTAKLERLKDIAEAGTYEADWINLILEAGELVVYRPVQHEAVAPYVKPYTPQTRDYSAKEAKDLLRRDWLFQADGDVTVDRIKSLSYRTRTHDICFFSNDNFFVLAPISCFKCRTRTT